MSGRRHLLAALLALATAGEALAQGPSRPAAPRRRLRRRRAEQPTPPEPAPAMRGEPAPLPNRDMRGPATPEPQARIEPNLLTPRTPGAGATFDQDIVRQRRDRLHDPAPGAAVRVPFSF